LTIEKACTAQPLLLVSIVNHKSAIENPMIPQIQPTELKRMLDAGLPVVLVDVRQPEEYAYCTLPDSVLIPLGELMTRVEEVQPGDAAVVVVYCHHGVRSLSGAAILRRAGIEAMSLAGGIDRWSLTVDASVPRY
jgi:rhodanese-related sulfurtransferase